MQSSVSLFPRNLQNTFFFFSFFLPFEWWFHGLSFVVERFMALAPDSLSTLLHFLNKSMRSVIKGTLAETVEPRKEKKRKG
jgi:competence CoiA-like predicted nuclease